MFCLRPRRWQGVAWLPPSLPHPVPLAVRPSEFYAWDAAHLALPSAAATSCLYGNWMWIILNIHNRFTEPLPGQSSSSSARARPRARSWPCCMPLWTLRFNDVDGVDWGSNRCHKLRSINRPRLINRRNSLENWMQHQFLGGESRTAKCKPGGISSTHPRAGDLCQVNNEQRPDTWNPWGYIYLVSPNQNSLCLRRIII